MGSSPKVDTMKPLSEKSQKVFRALQLKSETATPITPTKMPPLKSIFALMQEVGISCTINGSVNTVEHRSKGNRYVNSRHNGKHGSILMVTDDAVLGKSGIGGFRIDSSDSYYSCNSCIYAGELVKMINAKNK